MRVLLDTHTFFWSVMDVGKLSANAKAVLEDERTEVFVSVATAWEIAIKVGKAKWPEAADLIAQFETQLQTANLKLLQITVPHVRHAGLMVADHRDPFDRLLAAQAQIEDLTLVTTDPRLSRLGAQTLW